MIKKKTLYILLIILAVLCIACLIISGSEKHTEKMREMNAIVLSFNPDNASKLSWESFTSSYSFEKNADGVWVNVNDSSFPVNQNKISQLLESISAYSANFVIDEPSSLSDYGLKNPEMTINVTADGKDHVLKLGGYSSMDLKRYFSIEDGKAYLAEVDVLQGFKLIEENLIQYDKLDDMSDMKSIRVSGINNAEVIYKENADLCYSDEYHYYMKKDGKYVELSNYKAGTLCADIVGLLLDSYAAYGVTGDALAEYGMDNPEITVKINYYNDAEEGSIAVREDAPEGTANIFEHEFEMYINKKDDVVYGKLKTSDIIYKLSEGIYNDVTVASYDTMRQGSVALVDWTEVGNIVFTIDGESYKFTPVTEDELKSFAAEYEKATNEEKMDLVNPAEETDGWVHNGKYCKFSTISGAVDKLEMDTFTEDQPDKKMEIALKLTMNDGDVREAKLYKYDSEDCLAVIDGSPEGFVERDLVIKLVEAVNAYVL